jgi:uncharacterized protein
MGNDPLIEAIRRSHVDDVKALLVAGVRFDVSGVEQEWTPLCYAAGRGDLRIVELLVEAGADPASTGRDQRTPYEIAVAAGHIAVAQYLRGRDGHSRDQRPYCCAYSLRELRAFPAWPATESEGEAIVFVHHDLTVTSSMFHGDDVLHADDSPAWRSFCREVLRFKPPDDMALI